MLIGVFAIPITVAFGTLLISLQQTQSSQQASERQHQTNMQIANDPQQESTLQAYLDHMSDLLLNHQLLASKHSGDEVRVVARSWTLTTLRRVDPTRKIVVHQSCLRASALSQSTLALSWDFGGKKCQDP